MPLTRRETKTFPINIRELRVSRIEDVGTFRRITLAGPQLAGFTTADGIAVPPLRTEGFDDHVKVIVPAVGETRPIPPRQVEGHLDWSGSSPGKDYTPTRYDRAAGEIDLEFVRHPGGLAAGWAEGLTVGDPAWIAGPKSSTLAPAGFDWLLVGGDETALPAIGRLLAELPADARAQVLIEVAGPADERPLAAPEGVEVTWLHHGDAPAGTTTLLADAVRSLAWWPGEVFCWFAGEAQSLRPVRTHLKVDRGVPRDCVEVTGYWRRPAGAATTDAPVPVEDDGDEGWERLEALLDVSTPIAVRSALEAGVFTRLEVAPATVAELAGDLGLHAPTLRPLLRLLADLDLIAIDDADPALVADGAVALGPLGQLIVEDDLHLAFPDPDAFLDLDPLGTLAVLRSGRPVPRRDGRAAADVLAADDAAGAAVREARYDDAVCAAPSVVAHHDWSGYAGAVVVGDVHAALVGAFADVLPGLAVRGVPAAGDAVPEAGEAVVVMSVLEVLDDEAATTALAGLADRCRAVGAPLLVAERLTVPSEPVHDHDALLDLQLRAAFGSGLRTPVELTALFAAAGLAPADPDGVDLGWDMRLWALRA